MTFSFTLSRFVQIVPAYHTVYSIESAKVTLPKSNAELLEASTISFLKYVRYVLKSYEVLPCGTFKNSHISFSF